MCLLLGTVTEMRRRIDGSTPDPTPWRSFIRSEIGANSAQRLTLPNTAQLTVDRGNGMRVSVKTFGGGKGVRAWMFSV